MSRFTRGKSAVPAEETVTINVKAHLTMNLWIESVQMNRAQIILVTSTRQNEDKSETLIGRDGETGAEFEVTIKELP